MKMKIFIAAISTLLLLILSCTSSQTSEQFPYGSYSYRSFNFLGELVGEGTLYINEPDSNGITGNWHIRKVRECRNCGAQFGSGVLMGSVENDTLRINLNPNEIEIDTELIGEFGKGSFSGDWKWLNQEGFGYSGTFKAERL
ncbi:MAG: hypothetical protein HKM87_09770 [Ignavibacteriaceae bacterium]|nr:hypothetical protein [Ignavibacteriaceae bacterium]